MKKSLWIIMLSMLTAAGSVTLVSADESAAERYGYPELGQELAPQMDSETPQENYLRTVKVEFTLEDRDGKQVTQKDFLGKYILLTFGYTHCEHICPTILNDMAHTLKASGTDMAGIFISVDTERDSPRQTDDYASKFYQNITGLSGSYEEVAAAANNFNVRYSVTKTQNHYMVQHSSDIFYIGPDGKLIHVYTFNSLPHDLAK